MAYYTLCGNSESGKLSPLIQIYTESKMATRSLIRTDLKYHLRSEPAFREMCPDVSICPYRRGAFGVWRVVAFGAKAMAEFARNTRPALISAREHD